VKASTHGAVGAAVYSMVFFGGDGLAQYSWEIHALGLAAAVVAAGIPDLDIVFLGRRNHRGISHSLIACLVLAAALTAGCIIQPGLTPFFWSWAGAYFFHPVADLFTPKGICLFWPCKKRFSLCGKKCSSGIELIVLLAALILSVVLWAWEELSVLVFG